MAVVTITGASLAGGIPTGGAVGGASSLTTVGAIPYVVSSGVLGQDATAFFWDATNNRLGINTVSPSQALHVVGNATIQGDIQGTSTTSTVAIYGGGSYLEGTGIVLSATSAASRANVLLFTRGAFLESGRFTTNGNLLLSPSAGGTDGNYKLDVQTSGTTGTLRVYDQTATTGSTLAVIQAGAAQSTSALTRWRNNAGSELANINWAGEYTGYGLAVTTGTNGISLGTGFNTAYGAAMDSGWAFAWSSTSAYSGTKDLGLARNAAGVLEIDSGTAGQYRDLILRRSQHSGVAVSALPAAAAGNAGSIQYVTDANATTISSVVAGGGANKVLVWSDGANWKIMAN